MRAWPALFLAVSCQAPDRWHSSISRGQGDIDGYKGDFDTEDTRLEVGISGPLWAPPTTARAAQQPAPQPVVSSPEDDGLPWETVLLLLGGAAGYKGTEVGVQRVRRMRKKPD